MSQVSKVRYNYEQHKFDRYYGKRLFTVRDCGSRDQYRVDESILVRNEDGMIGSIGDGVTWALNWITNTGTCSFNPLKEDMIEWSPLHHAFIWKHHKAHFQFPVIIGQYYFLRDGKKFYGTFGEHEMPLLPIIKRGICV